MAISLDARYENFAVGDSPLLSALTGLSTFSISLWAKVDSTTKDHDFCIWGPHSATTGGWLFWRDDSGGAFGRTDMVAGLVDNDLRIETVNSSWNDTNWHHACLTVQLGSATGFNAYIDAVNRNYNRNSLAGYAALTGAGAGVPVRFGDSTPASSSSWMLGDLDDIRIYNRVLTPTEIQTIYNRRGTDDIINGLLVRYLLQDAAPGTDLTGASDEVRDSGPGGYDATANDPSAVTYPTYVASAVLSGLRRRAA
ncbi:MAG TPA: LamG-like jellyroll fold domain-containing protein [Steroidobacteraceae bacterium]|nr:LamG-like jellyroll fold domain-containing protein [Steroidobacteraceae bacterium]